MATKSNFKLEDILGKSPFAKFNPDEEAKKLINQYLELEIKRQQYGLNSITDYVTNSYKSNKWLSYMGRTADIADKITSVPGLVTTVLGLGNFVIPGIAAHLGEEAVECALKLPFYAQLLKKKYFNYAFILTTIEVGTIALPVIGDLVDIGTNIYVKTANSIIRGEAKTKLLNDINAKEKSACLVSTYVR